MEGIRYSDKKNDIRFDEVADLYESVGFGFSDVYKEDSGYEKAFRRDGCHGFFALDEKGRLIAMLRVLSDEKICTWIAEICVHPDYQGKGIGSHLIGMMDEKFGQTAIYVNALAGSEGFFEKNGIKTTAKLVACARAGSKQ